MGVDPDKVQQITKPYLASDTVDWSHLDPELRDCLMPLCNTDWSTLNSVLMVLEAGINMREKITITLGMANNKYLTINKAASISNNVFIIHNNNIYTEGIDFNMELVGSDRTKINWDVIETTLILTESDIIEVFYVTTLSNFSA